MNERIQSSHLRRLAIVYVRQSSPTQIRNNKESPLRQRALETRARQLGWPAERILVLDEERAKSATSTEKRNAYRRAAQLVAEGKAGIIFAVEVARWAREGVAWQLLLRDCIFGNVLLADENSIYDPTDAHDHVVLGIQGALAQYELHVMRDRMLTSWWAKAKRGEMFPSIPAGYVLVGIRLEKHPNQRIQRVIALLFTKFQDMSSVAELSRWFRSTPQLLPYVAPGDDPHNVQWQTPNYKRLCRILKNPFYTGAYVIGRTTTQVARNENGELIRRRDQPQPREKWTIEKDRFPAYISWEQYEQNVAKIERNATMRGNVSQPAPQRGPSLLSGLLRCRRCGHKLLVRYSRQRHAGYYCLGGQPQRAGGAYCMSFSGRAVEQAIAQDVLDAVRPAGIEAARRAVELLRENGQRERQLLVDRCTELRYETERARRQYNHVDPEHRLVAAELESRWNEALTQLTAQEARLEAFDRERCTNPTPEQVELLMSLGQRLDRVWHAEETDITLKQKIVRLLIHEILVDIKPNNTEVSLVIHWTGGHHTELSAPRRRRNRSSIAEIKMLITTLRAVAKDAEIAQALNRQGLRHGDKTWTAARVREFRTRHGIAAFDPQEKIKHGWLSQEEAAQLLEISPMSVHRLVRAGILPANQHALGVPCVIRQSDLNLPQVQEAARRIRSNLPRPLPADPNQQRLF